MLFLHASHLVLFRAEFPRNLLICGTHGFNQKYPFAFCPLPQITPPIKCPIILYSDFPNSPLSLLLLHLASSSLDVSSLSFLSRPYTKGCTQSLRDYCRNLSMRTQECYCVTAIDSNCFC